MSCGQCLNDVIGHKKDGDRVYTKLEKSGATVIDGIFAMLEVIDRPDS